jgi:hypothetical protein
VRYLHTVPMLLLLSLPYHRGDQLPDLNSRL